MKITCCQCGESHEYSENEVKWDEGGYGYSTKLVECPYCKQLNIVRNHEDFGLDVNKDKRFYE